MLNPPVFNVTATEQSSMLEWFVKLWMWGELFGSAWFTVMLIVFN